MAEMEALSEEERRALRGSKFAPLPPPSSSRSHQQPRLAHPGGPVKTNKAAALARFLERKLKDPNGFSNIDPDLIESAVLKAKASVSSSGASNSGRIVHHVESFGDSEDSAGEGKMENLSLKKHKKKKKKKQKENKRQKIVDDSEHTKLKKPKKKLKL
ncbi:hypothetical protein M5689_005547 [Euphorbia peplus]|nr:hypothetical protein M5689_005547 [Euphorbia peplus]